MLPSILSFTQGQSNGRVFHHFINAGNNNEIDDELPSADSEGADGGQDSLGVGGVIKYDDSDGAAVDDIDDYDEDD